MRAQATADAGRATWTDVSQGIATLLVRYIGIAVFVIVPAFYAAMAYKPANPQFTLLAFVTISVGAIAAWVTLNTGNLVTHPRGHEKARFW